MKFSSDYEYEYEREEPEEPEGPKNPEDQEDPENEDEEENEGFSFPMMAFGGCGVCATAYACIDMFTPTKPKNNVA